MATIKEAKFLSDLKLHIIREYGTNKNAGEKWGLYSTYLSKILIGDRPPTEEMLKEMGKKRIVHPGLIEYEDRE